MRVFDRLKAAILLKAKTGAWEGTLTAEGAWKNDSALCRELEMSGRSLSRMKHKISFDKEEMEEEIFRFFPEWEKYNLFSEMSLADLQWDFFSWDGEVQLALLVDAKRELFTNKWKISRFGERTGEEVLFEQAWELFSFGKAEVPEDVLSEKSQEALAPYLILWKEEAQRLNRDLRNREQTKVVLDMLYDYYVGECDFSDSPLPSMVDALVAGVPLDDILGKK